MSIVDNLALTGYVVRDFKEDLPENRIAAYKIYQSVNGSSLALVPNLEDGSELHAIEDAADMLSWSGRVTWQTGTPYHVKADAWGYFDTTRVDRQGNLITSHWYPVRVRDLAGQVTHCMCGID